MAGLIGVCSVLLTVKYFPGVESSQYYSGLILKTLHPELLANDGAHGAPFSVTGTPYRLSLYYLLPKLFGELWLDDRFAAPFYLAMVAGCFALVDRIAMALGGRGLFERAAIVLMFAKDHQILANKVNFAHDPDFHHSALAMPFSLLVLWAALAGRSVWVVLGLIILLAGVSSQVTPFAAAVGLGAVAIGAAPRQRRLALGLLGLGLLAGVMVMVAAAPPAADRVELWDMLAGPWYKNMANPFNTKRDGVVLSVVWNTLFLLLLAVARFWPGEATAPMRRLRMIATASFALWLAAGLYVQFSPTVAHFPQLLLFPFARQLQAAQVVIYVGAMVLLFRWQGQQPSLGRTMAALTVFAVLLVAGPGNYGMWAGMFALSSLAAAAVLHLRPRDGETAGGMGATVASRFPALVATALALGVAAMGADAIRQKAPAWLITARTGIHGASSQAKWLGVARYFRAKTPVDAVVLTYQVDVNGLLAVRRELASRSGRAMAPPFLLAHGLKLDYFRFTKRQLDLANDIRDTWQAGDAAATAAGLDEIRPRLDYVVMPSPQASLMAGSDFPFAPEATIDGFTIMRRVKGQGTAINGSP